MRKMLILCASLLALSAASAWAQNPQECCINLAWTDCPAGGGTSTRTFACTSNSGTNTLVGSFVAPAGVESVTANEIVIDVQTQNPTLAPWWSMRSTAPAGCRSALSQSGDFSANSACLDYWQLNASGGVSQDPPVGNRVRIKVLEGLPSGNPFIVPIPQGTEVYSFKVNISNAKTVGTGSCAGCSEEACIVLNLIRLNQVLPLPPRDISSPGSAQHVTWQGWTNPNPSEACPLATPAKQRTWGSVKALYR